MIEPLNFYFSQILPSLYTYVCMYAFIIFALNPSLENSACINICLRLLFPKPPQCSLHYFSYGIRHLSIISCILSLSTCIQCLLTVKESWLSHYLAHFHVFVFSPCNFLSSNSCLLIVFVCLFFVPTNLKHSCLCSCQFGASLWCLLGRGVGKQPEIIIPYL